MTDKRKLEITLNPGSPDKTGYYLVELDQPGLVTDHPYDVDYCAVRHDSEGRKNVEWTSWYSHNIRRWAELPSTIQPVTLVRD
jgi:hypothetical protein